MQFVTLTVYHNYLLTSAPEFRMASANLFCSKLIPALSFCNFLHGFFRQLLYAEGPLAIASLLVGFSGLLFVKSFPFSNSMSFPLVTCPPELACMSSLIV